MEKKAKFRVELEIEVEYNVPEEAEGITPYTTLNSMLNDNEISMTTDIGKIVNYDNIKFERLDK